MAKLDVAMEALKERIKIFLTIFQYGIYFFLGAGVSLVTYTGRQLDAARLTPNAGYKLDFVATCHVVLMLFAIFMAIFFLVKADRVNEELFEIESDKKPIE